MKEIWLKMRFSKLRENDLVEHTSDWVINVCQQSIKKLSIIFFILPTIAAFTVDKTYQTDHLFVMVTVDPI